MPADLCLIHLTELLSDIIIIHLSLLAVHTPIKFYQLSFRTKGIMWCSERTVAQTLATNKEEISSVGQQKYIITYVNMHVEWINIPVCGQYNNHKGQIEENSEWDRDWEKSGPHEKLNTAVNTEKLLKMILQNMNSNFKE
jgi:hypothetical protein